MPYSRTAFDVLDFGQSLGVLHEFGPNLISAKRARVLFRVVHRQYFMTVLVGVVAQFVMCIILQVHVSSTCLYRGLTSHTVVFGAVLPTFHFAFGGRLTGRQTSIMRAMLAIALGDMSCQHALVWSAVIAASVLLDRGLSGDTMYS